MANFKLFAEKDTTIYSDYPMANAGMDAILELSKTPSCLFSEQAAYSRSLIRFSSIDISNTISAYIGTGSYKAYLKLYMADTGNLPTDFTIICNPISQSWDMGTGRILNVPKTVDGVCWTYRDANNTVAWPTSSYTSSVTASYEDNNRGGGVWYTNFFATQSFGVYTEKDIELDVTNMVVAFMSGSLTNDGFILRISGSLEMDDNYAFKLCYFSRDTNTIYPPVLELRWADSSFSVVSASATPVSSQNVRVSIANLKTEYHESEIHRFRINVRDQFPTRVFATSSIYTQQKYLPSSSWWAIKDVKSDYYIVDFDDTYTRISADTNGNYFDVHMNGLEPERYYKLMIKTQISGSTMVFDDQYFFKVIT